MRIFKKQDMVYEAVSRLAQAIENQSIVMEGINTQLYLIRDEMVRNRLAKDDVMDNDVVFSTLVDNRIHDVLHPDYSELDPESLRIAIGGGA